MLAKAEAFVAEAPLRERRWALLATAQYQAGRQGDALRTLHRLRAVLDRELGLDPSPDIDALEQAILRQDPSLVVESALPEPSPVCPYQGLKPYDVDDADGFFGRDADVAACLRKLSDGSVLAVVGPSGCGKSSLVRAGVAAALRARRAARRGDDARACIRSRRWPWRLPGAGRRRRWWSISARRCSRCARTPPSGEAFLARVDRARRPTAPLILSFRADRLADISSASGLRPCWWNRGFYLLGGDDRGRASGRRSRSRPGWRRWWSNPGWSTCWSARCRPAGRAAADVARPGRDLATPRGPHPDRRRLPRLRRYPGAVAQSAEQVYERARAGAAPVLRDLLLRLVTPGPDGEPVRSRLPRRLVVTGAETRGADRPAGRPRGSSPATTASWSSPTSPSPGPGRGCAAGSTTTWKASGSCTTSTDAPTPGTRSAAPTASCTAASGSPRPCEWQAARTPDPHRHRARLPRRGQACCPRRNSTRPRTGPVIRLRVNRRLRAALATAAVLLVGALIAGFVAVRQADRAGQAATSELARRVGARALLTDDISQSLLLAVHGVRLDNSPETRTNLVAAMSRRPRLLRSIPAPLGRTDNLEVSPDGTRIVAGDDNATFDLYDARSGRVLGSYSFGSVPRGTRVFTTARFSPDGRLIAVTAAATRAVPSIQTGRSDC